MSLQVSQSPLFERKKKHLTREEIAVLDDEVRRFCKIPGIGAMKKGDLAGVSIHKFKVRDRLFLLAYEFDEHEVLLLTVGVHENFYRDLKRYLS